MNAPRQGMSWWPEASRAGCCLATALALTLTAARAGEPQSRGSGPDSRGIVYNRPPVAQNDEAVTDEDVMLSSTQSVLVNDTDPDGDPLSAVIDTWPSTGSLQFWADGTFVYTPPPNFSGRTAFTYRASDGLESSDTATVAITVNPVNDAPVVNLPAPGSAVGQVQDIYPGPGSSDPREYRPLGNALYFGADDGTNGPGLWRTDGTPDGTALVRSMGGMNSSGPYELTNAKGALYYVADDGTGPGLWRSDGTEAGTSLVQSFDPNGGWPYYLTPAGNSLYFVTDNPSTLWTFDAAGTGVVPVKEINPTGDAGFKGLTDVNGTLYFTADDGQNGAELWRSDGTPDGTQLVGDINPGGSSDPFWLTNVNGALYFAAGDGTNGRELWKYDPVGGSPPQAVADINPYGNSTPTWLTNVNGALYFVANDGPTGAELWKYDPSAGGPLQVKDINPGGPSFPTSLTNVNGTLFFAADDGLSGTELWRSDGTSDGTVMVKNINPYSCAIMSDLAGLVNVGQTLYFVANDGEHGFELWQSDGTEAGTKLVQDIFPGPQGPFPGHGTSFGGTLFFGANNGTSGNELWSATPVSPPLSVPEDGSLPFSSSNQNQISVSDPDAGDSPIQGVLSVRNGTLTLARTDGLLFTSGGNGQPTMGFTGTLADINAALNGLTYQPGTNFSGADTFTYSINDQGNTGAGGELSSTATLTITVNPVNDAPLNTVPTARQETGQNLDLLFGPGTGNAISISDPDAGDTPVRLQIGVQHGTLFLATTQGLQFPVGGNGQSSMTVIGSQTNINAALNGLAYRPVPGFTGPDTFAIQTDDLGHTGGGGALTDTDSIGITVLPPTRPTAVPDAYEMTEDVPLDALSVLANDRSASGNPLTAVLDTAPAVGELNLNPDGTFTYRPVLNDTGTKTFTYRANDGIASSDTATVTITVNPVNDAPVLSVPAAPQATPEDTPLRFSPDAGNAIVVGDVDAGDGEVEVQVTVQNGTFTLVQTDGLLFTGGANGQGDMTFRGLFGDIQARMQNVYYGPPRDFNGVASFAITVNDLGHNGAGGSQSSRATVPVTVNPVNDAPLVMMQQAAVGVSRVKDIAPGSGGSLEQGSLYGVGNTLFFAADDGVHGLELWRSDGTAAGTTLVADINPTGNGEPLRFTDVNGTLFFVANSSTDTHYDYELWRSDGTAAGTAMVKNINPTVGANPRYLTPVGGVLYFAADDGVNGPGLWRSDGTEAGTTLVKSVSLTSGSLYPPFTTVGNTLYFVGNDAVHGKELWKSDGTEVGTVMVKDINPTGDAMPNYLTAMDGVLYFAALSDRGEELWRSDGTAAGTRVVRDSFPAGGTGPKQLAAPEYLTVANGQLFFAAHDGVTGGELWRSDGTSSGTYPVKDIRPGAFGSLPHSLVAGNDLLYFLADDRAGHEFWKSDGTEGGTAPVKVINPTGSAFSTGYIGSAVLHNGLLYFRARDGVHGDELWQTDGTEVGTRMVHDINPGAPRSYPMSMTGVGSTLFFAADDGTSGFELWQLGERKPLLSLPEDDPLSFSPANQNRISVTDVDAGLDPIQVQLTATNGTLTLPHTTGLTFADGTSNGQDRVAFTGTIADINTALDGLLFQPLANYSGSVALTVTANDLGHNGEGGPLEGRLDVTVGVQGVNDPPVLVTPLQNQAATVGQPFSYTVPPNTFGDVDAGDTLTLSAGTADRGALPSWLSFEPDTATFRGTPEPGDVGVLLLQVTATDIQGASATAPFTLTVSLDIVLMRLFATNATTPELSFGQTAAALAGLDILDVAGNDQGAEGLAAVYFLLLDQRGGGMVLSRDIRPAEAISRWRLLVVMEAGVPDVVLSWDVTAVPAGKNVYLQRLAGEQPVGAPVPMTQLESVTVSESAAFEIALAELQQATVELQPGWNLVGIPLMTTATLAELFPEHARSGVAVTCYSWDGSEYGAVDLGQVLNPERGYWLHVDREARSATFSGIVADGVLELAGTVGWRLFSPPSRQPVPATVPFLGPLWRFETATRRYLGVALDTPLEPGLAYWGFIP